MSTFTEILKGLSENWPGTLLLLVSLLALLSLLLRFLATFRNTNGKAQANEQDPAKSATAGAAAAGSPTPPKASDDGWMDRTIRSITDYRRLLGLLVAVGLPALCWYLVVHTTLEGFRDLLVVLSKQWNGALMLLLGGFAMIWFISKLARVFAFGRHEPRVNADGADVHNEYSELLATFVFKIISQFRHLLALVVVLIFAIALAYAMWMAQDTEDLTKTLQAVMATLGGLVGSIIGYYFGESKAETTAGTGTDDTKATTTANAQQLPPSDGGAPADVRVPTPPAGV